MRTVAVSPSSFVRAPQAPAEITKKRSKSRPWSNWLTRFAYIR